MRDTPAGNFAVEPRMETPDGLSRELVEAARAAGALLMSYYERLGTSQAQRKEGRRRDLVSEADIAAEALILERIPEADGFLAEEGGGRGGTSGRDWLVDPLDGTINFLHGLPVWAVSLAVLEAEALAAGVVHAPALGWTFVARRGQGARLNDQPVRVSATAEIEDAILATGFPYARDTLADNNLENVPRIGEVAGGLRRMGAAAIDLALVAAGRLDGFWELHLNPWDVAAGILLVREAGGRVTDFRGGDELHGLLHARNLVATNGRIHESLRGRLAPLREL